MAPAQKPAAPKADAPKKPALVRMVRDASVHPAPHTADVHPDEVANYALGGWAKA